LLPAIRDLRRTAVEVAIAVGADAQRQGLAPASTVDNLRRSVVGRQWEPTYDAFRSK
jgi:malate dehydrogenase (oxaloacetate-decarboxylating)